MHHKNLSATRQYTKKQKKKNNTNTIHINDKQKVWALL